MTEDTSTSDKYSMLFTKVERESRFTRSVVVICTIANLGVLFYAIVQIFTVFPTILVGQYMANLDKIVYQTKAIEMTMPHRGDTPKK